MSKCHLCGREIGSTAGPCVQCTIEMKYRDIKIEDRLSSCPACKSKNINQIDTIMFLCETCNRLF